MNALKTAIRTRLTAATALTALLSGTAAVYSGLAPSGATLPYVVYTIVSDTELNETPKVERDYLVDIKGISVAGDMADSIAAQIRTAMQTDIAVTGWGVVDQKRERGINLREVVDGKIYYHAGETDRIRLEES